MTNERIGDWTKVEKLGDGGQGVVFRVVREEGQEPYAMKVLKPSSKRHARFARFKNEIEVHKRFSDNSAPNIIPVVDHHIQDEDGDDLENYIVMPLAISHLEESKELFQNRIELCIELLKGICTGLAYAHEQDPFVVHRDIKPKNILFLDKSFATPLISDFGICLVRDAERYTRLGETVGAQYFMAPEQEEGLVADITPASDVYAIGKLFCYLYAGTLVHRENYDAIKFPTDDDRVVRIVSDVLPYTIEADPQKRFQSAGELLEVLSDIQSTSGTPTASPETQQGSGSGAGAFPADDMPSAQKIYEEGVVEPYDEYCVRLLSGDRTISLEFDEMKRLFGRRCQEFLSEADHDPRRAGEISRRLIVNEGTTMFSLCAAIARVNAKAHVPDINGLLEFITRVTDKRSGRLAVIGVPHALAGFLFMSISLVAFSQQSFDVLKSLLTYEYEYYYQSGRPLYDYGADHPYFFHSEAFQREATKIHDLFRGLLLDRPFQSLFHHLNLSDEDIFDIYMQTQFLISLGSYIREESETSSNYSSWPDFGRFNMGRVLPLFERLRVNSEYGAQIASIYDEGLGTFKERLPERLGRMRRSLANSPYMWTSIEPQDLS